MGAAGAKTFSNAVQHLSDNEQKLGYKLLLYINFCLSGKAFPRGDIPKGLQNRVKFEVYSHLLRREGDLQFPFTRTMLQFDTKEFLNVIAIAFEVRLWRPLIVGACFCEFECP